MEVDFQLQVGPVTKIKPHFAFVNFSTHLGSQSSSIDLGSDAILLITNAIFHNLKNALTLNEVPST